MTLRERDLYGHSQIIVERGSTPDRSVLFDGCRISNYNSSANVFN